jgi:molybdopterin-guanine dinucleotide biosynthesis protein B
MIVESVSSNPESGNRERPGSVLERRFAVDRSRERNLPGVVIGVVGPSGTGKTSLLVRIVPALRKRGLTVGVVKHASHGFLADSPGKDSHRLYESGAAAVGLISREQVAIFARRCEEEGEEVSLSAALSALPDGLEVILAEGFSWEPIPRVVLSNGVGETAPKYTGPGEVIDIVTVPSPVDGRPPDFSDELVESLARIITARVRGTDGHRGEAADARGGQQAGADG